MSKARLSSRERRALAAGAVVIVSVVAISRLAPAVLAWSGEIREERLEAEHALDGDRALLGDESAVRESTVVRGRRIVALASAILSGESVNAAGATLSGVISGAAAAGGVRLGTVQLRGDSISHGAFTRIGAHVEATGDIRGVTKMLSALEAGPPLLAIRTFSIEQREPGAGDDRVEALHVQLDIEGLMLNPKVAR